MANSALRTTPLHGVHRAAGARLVDFAGWKMPLHYGSQIEEHHAVRRAAGMFDVSHMRVVDLVGEGARLLLAHALANDIGKIATPGRALYSCMLNERGGVVDDLIAYFLDDGAFRLVVNAGTADKDVAWLRQLAATRAPRLTLIERTDLALVAVQGPEARAKAWTAFPGLVPAVEGLRPFSAAFFRDWFVSRTGYTGEDGYEMMIPGPHAQAAWSALERVGVKPCGLGARDTLRLEAGMNLYGQDLDEDTSPLESGVAWTVDTSSERDFVGRAALAARPPERALRGLVLLDAGVLRAHQTVKTAHGDGETTSGSFSPTLGRSIALARLPAAVSPGDDVTVEVRGRTLAARVVRHPFVRHGRSRVDSFLPPTSTPGAAP
jgi:aminomethyltransferase